MTPNEIMEKLAAGQHFYDIGLVVVEGPHNVSDQKSVLYVREYNTEGPKFRIEVTQ